MPFTVTRISLKLRVLYLFYDSECVLFDGEFHNIMSADIKMKIDSDQHLERNP